MKKPLGPTFSLGNLALALLFSSALPAFAASPTQAILPNGLTQFFDSNGAPLASGQVFFYVPNTTTPQTTYKDPYGSVANTNPVTLDSAGRAIIWGSGLYREVLKDQFGNTLWDQPTLALGQTASQSVLWFGTATGSPNIIVLSGPTFAGTDGQEIGFLASSTNTGAVTVNITGYGILGLQKNAASGITGLTGGEIVAGNLYYATYSTAAGGLILQGNPPAPSQTYLAGAVSGSANAITVGSTSPANFVLMTGTTLLMKPTSAPNTGSVTVTVSGGTYNVFRQTPLGAVALVGGEISNTNEILQLVYDGTEFQMAAPTDSVPSGAVMPFNLTTCPLGWAAADGTGGTVNMLGTVVRGLDLGATRDPAGASQSVGSYEADQLQDHTHNAGSGSFVISPGGGGYGSVGTGAVLVGPSSTTGTMATGNHGPETRVKATILLYCQKK